MQQEGSAMPGELEDPESKAFARIHTFEIAMEILGHRFTRPRPNTATRRSGNISTFRRESWSTGRCWTSTNSSRGLSASKPQGPREARMGASARSQGESSFADGSPVRHCSPERRATLLEGGKMVCLFSNRSVPRRAAVSMRSIATMRRCAADHSRG